MTENLADVNKHAWLFDTCLCRAFSASSLCSSPHGWLRPLQH